jgi:hypothetical protein
MSAKVYVRKARTFGEVFGDTIGYLKQNFKPLFGSILFLVAPFVLLATILIINLFKGAFAGAFGSGAFGGQFGAIALTMFLITILYLLGYTAFVTVLNEHMVLNDALPPNERPQIRDIVKNFLRPFLRGLGAMFLLLIINMFLVVIIGLIIAAFGFLIKESAILGILLFMLLYLFFLVVIVPIVLYLFSSILFTAQRHKINVFKAIGKVFRNFKGNFWLTWAVSFLGGMIIQFLSFIAFLPSYILFVISMFTRVSRIGMDPGVDTDFEMPLYMVILFCITGVIMVCIYAIYFVMMNLQCASLEEKKEGISILEKIESI